MARADTILDSVQRIYNAVPEPDGWGAVMAAAAATARCQQVTFFVHNVIAQATEFIAGHGIAPQGLAGFAAAGAGKLPDWRLKVPLGTLKPRSAVWSDKEYVRTDFYNHAIRPLKAFYGAMLPLARDNRRHIYLGVARLDGGRDFDPDDVAATELLAPHVATAWRLRQRFEQANLAGAGACAMLDRLETGVILVDAAMRPVFVNAQAAALAEARDGLIIGKSGVTALQAEDTRALHRAIAAAIALNHRTASIETVAQSGSGMRLCLSRRGKPPLVASVVPIGAAQRALWPLPRALAGIFIVKPEAPPRIDADLLAEAFRLAPREAQLAARLAQGSDLGQAASALGITIGTARWYLRRVLEKTETRRQAELVALILRGFSRATRDVEPA